MCELNTQPQAITLYIYRWQWRESYHPFLYTVEEALTIELPAHLTATVECVALFKVVQASQDDARHYARHICEQMAAAHRENIVAQERQRST